MGEYAVDIIQIRAGDGLLRLHDLEIVGDSGIESLAGQLEIFLRDLYIFARLLPLGFWRLRGPGKPFGHRLYLPAKIFHFCRRCVNAASACSMSPSMRPPSR